MMAGSLVKLNLEYLKEIIPPLGQDCSTAVFHQLKHISAASYTSLDFPVWQEEVGEVVEDTSVSAEQLSLTWLRGSST